MDNLTSEFRYYALEDGQAKLKTQKVELEDYKRANNQGMNLKQYLNEKCEDAHPEYGCAFDQAVQEIGATSRVHGGNRKHSPTLAQLYQGMEAGPAMAQNMASTITAPNGADKTPAGRIFYPEIVMDMMRDSLTRDNGDIENGFDNMISVTENISGGIYVQPKVNVTSNENVAAQTIAQGSDPAVMVNITTSQSTKSIPTKSIGLQITDQAMQFATLDLVATAVAAQSRGERIRMVESDIAAMITGDSDSGISALTPQQLKAYDASITTAGTASHKAFLKMLHKDYQKLTIDSAIMDIDTYLAYEGRTGRPTVDKDQGNDSRLNTNIRPINFSLSDLNILIVDSEIIGANRAAFIDSRYAMRKVVDVTAQYEAVQQFVMRRISQMRMDYGQHVTRLYDEAWKVIDLTV